MLFRSTLGPSLTLGAPHAESHPSHSALTLGPSLTPGAPHAESHPSHSALTLWSCPSHSALALAPPLRGSAATGNLEGDYSGLQAPPSSCANSAAQWVDFMKQTPSSRSISCKKRDSCYFCAKLIEFRSENSLRDLLPQLQF